MAYRRFKLPEPVRDAATHATPANVHPIRDESVASVANVAIREDKDAACEFTKSVATADWDEHDWRAFFDERAGIAEFDGGLSRADAQAMAFACCVSEWLNRNAQISSPEACLVCQGADSSGDPLVPFGISDDGRAWLHPRCWDAWYKARQSAAIAALAVMGIDKPSKFPSDFAKNEDA